MEPQLKIKKEMITSVYDPSGNMLAMIGKSKDVGGCIVYKVTPISEDELAKLILKDYEELG